MAHVCFEPLLIGLLLVGCFGSHGRDGAPPAPTPEPAPAPAPTPTPHPEPVPEPGVCSVSDGSISVRVEMLPGSTTPCERDGVFGSAEVLAVEEAPRDDGVRILIDGCPGADASCVCAVTVGGVGAELAHRLPRSDRMLRFVTGRVDERRLVLWADPGCDDCVGCECGPSPILIHAEQRDLLHDTSPMVGPLSVSLGELACSDFDGMSDRCFTQGFDLLFDWRELVSGEPGEAHRIDVPEGATFGVPYHSWGTHDLTVTNLRSHDDVCPETDFDEGVEAVWVAYTGPAFVDDTPPEDDTAP